MYNCHPQLSHQLSFDQGVQIVITPSSVVYEIYNSTIDFASIFIKVMQLCMFVFTKS